ncbi:MAG: cupin domain-containing protein [Azospirillaceae bacterium]|nr:cupin domain-containing protein [Azospirillaceae bacterium]
MTSYTDLLTNPEGLEALVFEPFRDGITAAWLYRSPDGGPASAVLRYQPGARVPRHRHVGWEQVILLRGSQRDATGMLRAGSVATNAPGTEHDVYSEEGCLALLVWERQPEILGE